MAPFPQESARIKYLTDDYFAEASLEEVRCRSCSGYGNCGFRSMNLYNGKVVSICQRTRSILLTGIDPADTPFESK